MNIEEARRHFFVERDDVSNSFRIPDWRGAALDRDKYGFHRMPRILWDTLLRCSASSEWKIAGHAPIGYPVPPAISIPNRWESFALQPENPARESPEWVAYTPDADMAILAGVDVTVVGMHQTIAACVDAELALLGTSLRAMTQADLGSEDDWPFLASVLR